MGNRKARRADTLHAVAVFEEMVRRHSELGADVRRTMERRIRAWRALHRPEQEVSSRQTHEPGRMALSDLTDMSDLGLIVAGAPLHHSLAMILEAKFGQHQIPSAPSISHQLSPSGCEYDP